MVSWSIIFYASNMILDCHLNYLMGFQITVISSEKENRIEKKFKYDFSSLFMSFLTDTNHGIK